MKIAELLQMLGDFNVSSNADINLLCIEGGDTELRIDYTTAGVLIHGREPGYKLTMHVTKEIPQSKQMVRKEISEWPKNRTLTVDVDGKINGDALTARLLNSCSTQQPQVVNKTKSPEEELEQQQDAVIQKGLLDYCAKHKKSKTIMGTNQ